MLRKSRPARAQRRESKQYKANLNLFKDGFNVQDQSNEEEKEEAEDDIDPDIMNVDVRQPTGNLSRLLRDQNQIRTHSRQEGNSIFSTPRRHLHNE